MYICSTPDGADYVHLQFEAMPTRSGRKRGAPAPLDDYVPEAYSSDGGGYSSDAAPDTVQQEAVAKLSLKHSGLRTKIMELFVAGHCLITRQKATKKRGFFKCAAAFIMQQLQEEPDFESKYALDVDQLADFLKRSDLAAKAKAARLKASGETSLRKTVDTAWFWGTGVQQFYLAKNANKMAGREESNIQTEEQPLVEDDAISEPLFLMSESEESEAGSAVVAAVDTAVKRKASLGGAIREIQGGANHALQLSVQRRRAEQEEKDKLAASRRRLFLKLFRSETYAAAREVACMSQAGSGMLYAFNTLEQELNSESDAFEAMKNIFQ